jgi:RNA polymerase sigma factor (sigma-70 family)
VHGSDTAFDRLYERCQPHVLSYCLRRTVATDAADACAEVFAIAWRRRADMPGGNGALPWLYGVARKVLGHQWRGSRRRLALKAKAGGHRAPPPLTPEDVLVESEEHVKVRQALHRLGDLDREVLMLSAWEGLSHSEIAVVVGASLAAVDKRLVRAKRRLAREYDVVTKVPEGRARRGGAGS